MHPEFGHGGDGCSEEQAAERVPDEADGPAGAGEVAQPGGQPADDVREWFEGGGVAEEAGAVAGPAEGGG